MITIKEIFKNDNIPEDVQRFTLLWRALYPNNIFPLRYIQGILAYRNTAKQWSTISKATMKEWFVSYTYLKAYETFDISMLELE